MESYETKMAEERVLKQRAAAEVNFMLDVLMFLVLAPWRFGWLFVDRVDVVEIRD